MNVDVTRRVELTSAGRLTLIALALVGVIVAAVGVRVAPDRMWGSWLLAGYYALGLGLAGLCFLAIHYTTGATWSAGIRPVAEALAGTLPLALAFFVVVLVARPQLYAWTAAGFGVGAGGEMAFKRFWLSRSFFLSRAVIYAVTWIAFAFAIRRRSRWNLRLSAAFLIVFSTTFTLASFDWIMSLDPLWYSTIFGVYNFAGLFLSGLAAIILVALWLERKGPLANVLNDEHLHDLGKLLFAFSTFWMYIWFSQYLLIWYTNIPEETSYFVRRMHGLWLALVLANVVLNWVVPFTVLLRRDTKRLRLSLGLVAAVVLTGRWLDLYLMIFPSVVGEAPLIGLWEVGLTAGGVGCFGLVLARILRGTPVVPLADH